MLSCCAYNRITSSLTIGTRSYSPDREGDLVILFVQEEKSREPPDQEALGYVYVLSHCRIPGMVKIGYTNSTVEGRVEHLSSATGVPGKFRIAAVYETTQASKIESRVHAMLSSFRLLRNREFFECSAKHACEVIEAVLTKEVHLTRGVGPGDSFIKVSDMDLLGKEVRKARRSKKMTQVALAKVAKCGPRFVGEVENGKETAEAGILLRVISAAGLSIAIGESKEVDNFTWSTVTPGRSK